MKCPQCEALNRAQQDARFADCDPGDCDIESVAHGLSGIGVSRPDGNPLPDPDVIAAMFPVPVAMDAGSIGETRTDRRIQYELTSERTKQTIVDDLAEALTAYKWSHLALDEAIERAKAIVLDTVAA